MEANRVAYGKALVEIGRANDNVVVLDADLGKATNSIRFKVEFPERYIDCGIAEQNMIGIAAGLAASGKIPFASAFSVFVSMRAVEQLRNSVCYPELNVKVVGTHAGIECGGDGATHQAIEDLAITRSIPKLSVLVPADHVATGKIVKLMAQHKGPMFMRVGRDANAALYDENEEFVLGGSKQLRAGTDITIMAIGSMVSKAIEAAKILAGEGIEVRVLDMYSIKPIDKEAIVRAAKETKGIVTVEDHNVIGGLGSAVSEVVTSFEPTVVKKIGIQDCFGRSGESKELFALYGLTVRNIVKTVKEII